MKKLLLSFLFIFALASSLLHAQDMAYFSVNYQKVCLGTAIQLTDQSSGGNGDATYTFGDGTLTTPPNPNPSHTYTSANTFTLKQILPIPGTVIDPQTGNPVGYMSYSIPITVVNNTDLSVSYNSFSNNEVQFIVNDSRFDSYEIDFGDGSGLTSVDRNTSGTITTFNHTFPTTYEYSVSVKVKFIAGNTCPTADVVLAVTPPLMSANDSPSPVSSINLYPNPLKQGEQLYFNNELFKATQVIVYNSSGNIVVQSYLTDHTLATTDLSTLSAGFYLVRMINNKNESVSKSLMIW
ncbi:MAG: PKD domain-containing protein [Cytophagaceae bacterium]|nr:PKD domain-containing protein [Cytophagaceae bacterium]